jgi:hypothetical protein
MKSKSLAALAAALALFTGLCAQGIGPSPLAADPAASASASGGYQALPRGFRALTLGMGLDEAKAALKADGLFGYRGDADVSLLAAKNESLIDCLGASYVKRAWFQFRDKRLYAISLVLNPEKVDHYSVFTHSSEKYGPPTRLNPQETVWEDGATRYSIERPLTVKYLDLAVFAQIQAQGKVRESKEELDRRDFIDAF